jgi:hypothetical protein
VYGLRRLGGQPGRFAFGADLKCAGTVEFCDHFHLQKFLCIIFVLIKINAIYLCFPEAVIKNGISGREILAASK